MQLIHTNKGRDAEHVGIKIGLPEFPSLYSYPSTWYHKVDLILLLYQDFILFHLYTNKGQLVIDITSCDVEMVPKANKWVEFNVSSSRMFYCLDFGPHISHTHTFALRRRMAPGS